MYESDNESESSFSEPEKQIVIHHPLGKNNFQDEEDLGGNEQVVDEIMNKMQQIERKCMEISRWIQQKTIQALAEDVHYIKIRGDFKTKNQERKKYIFPVYFQSNQGKYVQEFINKFEDLVKERNAQSQNISKRYIEYYRMEQTSVSMIAMKIHHLYKKRSLKDAKILVINTKITNLQPSNLQIFEDGIKQYNCDLLLPTNHTFAQFNSYKYNKFEVITFRMYDNILMLYQFFYQCIVSQEIKAYLPKQALIIFNQVVQFPISYRQACRRLIFCIKKLHLLADLKNIKIEFINIGKIFDIIHQSFLQTKNMTIQEYASGMKMKGKHVCVILDESQLYNITQSYLRILFLNRGQEDEQETRKHVVKKAKKYMKEQMAKSEQMKEDIYFLENNPYQVKNEMKSRKRVQNRYQINTTKVYPEHIVFEEQVKKIVLKYTQRIKEQSRKFKWADFHYQQQIKPMIPLEMFLIFHQIPQIRHIITRLTNRSQRLMNQFVMAVGDTNGHNEKYENLYIGDRADLKSVLKEKEKDEELEDGRTVYLIKELQLYGIVVINKFAINSKVILQYYSKSKYFFSDNDIKLEYSRKEEVWL